jgi:hypothetical protein
MWHQYVALVNTLVVEEPSLPAIEAIAIAPSARQVAAVLLLSPHPTYQYAFPDASVRTLRFPWLRHV